MAETSAIKEQLRQKGISLRAWAIQHGHRPKSVYTVVSRWGSRADRPLGGISRKIMAELRRELLLITNPGDPKP